MAKAKAIEKSRKDKKEVKPARNILSDNWPGLFQALPVPVFIFTPQGKILEVNQEAVNKLGYSRKEMLDKSMDDITSPEFNSAFHLKINKLSSRKSIQFESEYRTKNGKKVPIDVKASLDNSKGLEAILAICREIKISKSTDQALIESEKLKSLILDSSSEIFTYYDKDQNIVYTNSMAANNNIKSKSGLLKSKCYQIFYNSETACKDCHVIEVIKSGQYREVKNKTLGDRVYHIRAYPIKDDKDQLIGVAEFGLDITEEREFKEKLEQSEAKFRALSNATFESLFLISSGLLIEANQTATEMFGYSSKELRNKDIYTLFSPDNTNVVRDRLTSIKKTAIDIIGQKKDGQIFNAQIRVKGMDYKGQAVKVMAVRDITSKKRTENIQSVIFKIANAVNITKDLVELFSMIRSELSRVIDTSNFMIALYDKDSDTISLPYYVDEKDSFDSFPAGKTLTKYLLNQRKGLLLRKPDIVELKKANEIEFLGTICEVWLGVPLMASNRIIGALIVQSYSDEKAYSEKDLDVLTFVSTQIGLSVERKISENSIKENEEKLRAFFKSGIAGTCFCSIKGEIKDANREFQRILGYSGDEIVGETIDWKKQTPKEFHVIDEQKMLEAKLKGSCTPYEKQLISRDGKLIWVLIGFVLIGESKDQMILFMLDLTQRKNFELKLKESRRKAEESDILKTAFLANMSHEIRTPMNAIVGFTSFLGDPFYSNNEKAEFVGVIQKNVNALLDLIDDIIDISKIESGELRIKKVEFSLKTILDEMNKTFNNLIKSSENCKAKLEIIYTEGIEKIILYNDPNRLRQVFTNLISNAIKFTEKGKIILGYELQDHNIQFYVSDTGIGMSPEDLNIIFDRFSQAKNSLTREHGGTGLGLTISKNLVNFMGGDLWVESKLGIGSKFIFNLPFNKEEKNINEHKEGEIIEIDEAPDWSDHKILVAEDIESNFRILEQILKSTHASIIWVKKGNEAVRICKQDMEIDAVLMDVQMPGMNGYEATSLIKKFRKDLPVVAITAFAMSNEREKSRQAGCDEYIPKPIRKQRLFAILHAFLKEN